MITQRVHTDAAPRRGLDALTELFRADATVQTPASYRDDLITILMGAWLMVGLFVDGWAHNNIPVLETFFTPWHGIFYSGFAATTAWMCWLVIRNLRAGKTGAAAIPYGYGLGLAGLAIFGLGGVGDMIWHIIFGIEKDIQALLSPTHLLIFLGGTTILSTPARAAWSRREERQLSFRMFLPVLLSITATAAFVVFMNQYAYALKWTVPFERILPYYDQFTGQIHDHIGFHLTSARGNIESTFVNLASTQILVTTMMLMAPLLLLVRRWRLPAGSLLFLLGVIGLLMDGMYAFRFPVLLLGAPLAAAVGAELLYRWLRPSAANLAGLRLWAFLVPVLLWSAYFLIGGLLWGLLWSPELWAGITVSAGLGGLILSIVMVPAMEPQP